MKRKICICGVIGSVVVLANPAAAQWTVLQIVDLTELGMSTESGEATLYRLPDAGGANCKIQVVHFGETGKTIHDFEFGSRLSSAEKKEFRYKVPLSVNAKAKPILTEKLSLASPKGRDVLPKEFEAYKSAFDPKQLAKCTRR